MTHKVESKSILDKFTVLDRAVLYARVSGDDRGKEGRNLQGQLDMGREYAKEKGYTIIAELSEDDRGASGAEIDLPQLNRVREMAYAGQFDVLIVRELDRLSRNLAKQLIVEEELKKCGVRVEYVLAEYDDTPEGRLQKHIRGTIAEYEREKIRERMTRGKRNKVKAGSVNTGNQPPFGYRFNNDRTCFEIEPVEAEIVRFIFEQYLNGHSIGAIRDKLMKAGIPSPSDLRKFNGVVKRSEYGKWARSVVARILANQTYTGLWHYGKDKKLEYQKSDGGKGYRETKHLASNWIEVKVPAIVPQDVFDFAQEKLAENKNRQGQPGTSEILLRKRCTCGECGYKMGTMGKGHYYTCGTKTNKDCFKTCSQKSFKTDMADTKIWQWLEEILTDQNRLEEEIANVEAKQDKNGAMLQSQLEAANSKIAELNQELTELVDVLKALKKGGKAYAAVLTDIERVEETIAKIEVQQAKIKGQLNQVMLSPEDKDRLRNFAAKVSAGIEEARRDFNLRRAIVDLLDVQVRLVREDGKAIAYVTCILHDYEAKMELSPTMKPGFLFYLNDRSTNQRTVWGYIMTMSKTITCMTTKGRALL
ncbi:MAG: serine recombinase [Chloroflexota bacterium]|nr:MAG: serine recombinase [Chloroflexota bacterium]